MFAPTHHLRHADAQQLAFLSARRYVGYRVRARAQVRLNLEIAEGSTGTEAFVAAPHREGVWIAVAWDFLVERVQWYTEDTFLEGVSIFGIPLSRPVPTRHRTRDFTTAGAFRRLGRRVHAVRRPTRAIAVASAGVVSRVIADEQRLLLAITWSDPSARPDETWFSRCDYRFYISDELGV
jgi:hypothetical protein